MPGRHVEEGAEDDIIAFDFVSKAGRASARANAKLRSTATVYERERDAKVQRILSEYGMAPTEKNKPIPSPSVAAPHTTATSQDVGVHSNRVGPSHTGPASRRADESLSSIKNKNFRHNLYVTRNALREVDAEHGDFLQMNIAAPRGGGLGYGDRQYGSHGGVQYNSTNRPMGSGERSTTTPRFNSSQGGRRRSRPQEHANRERAGHRDATRRRV